MGIRHKNRVAGNFIAGIVLILAFARLGMCQTAAPQENDPASSEPQEEIVVYGKKSLVNLQYEWYTAQEEFFDMFNSLNSNDEFDFKCEYVTYLGYRKRNHLCQPNFFKSIQAQAAGRIVSDMNSAVGGLDGLGGAAPASGRFRAKLENMDKLMWDEMATLVLAHPELHEKYAALANAKRVYESEKQKRRP